MKHYLLIFFVILLSCTEKNSLAERKIRVSQLIEPKDYIYVELLTYYSSSNKKDSNFYIVKNIHTNDTIYVVDKNSSAVADFIKNYDGIENTGLVLQKGKSGSKKEYFISIPSDYDLNSKTLYLGELIRIID